MNQPAASTRKLMKIAQSAMEKNRGSEAMGALRQIIAINPLHAEALYSIGFIYHSAGKYAEGANFYQQAINADYTFMDSYFMLCKLLESQNRGEEAMRIAQRATEVAPNNPKTHGEFVTQLMRFNQSHIALPYVEQALKQFPRDTDLLQLYALSLKVNDRFDEAEKIYETLLREHRVPLHFRFLFETYLPRLSQSNEQIDNVRARFKASLEGFLQQKQRISVAQIPFQPVFQLAFHNRDNKELMQLYCKTLRHLSPELNYTAPHCKTALIEPHGGPIRIGFVSRHMHEHSVGNCFRGILIHLSQQPEFEVTFFNLANVMDHRIQELMDAKVPITSLPKALESARDTIAAHKLDILIYPDIGMDAMTSYLAMGRLARYQACFMGHPDTTGIDTIDYFIAMRTHEPENAQENYTEQLLCVSGVDSTFTRPKVPERWLTRTELQLPEGKRLYVCPMAIQKFHPDFDRVLAMILQRDPEAVILLFNDFQQQSASDTMRARILVHCDPSRIIFMPWLRLDALFSVLKLSNVILDTVYFGGGTTIQYAFGLGLPMVSMPSNHARGRMVASYYSILGIENPPLANTLEDYATLAVSLAQDKPRREALSEQILANNSKLFEDSTCKPVMVQLMKDIMHQSLEAYRR